ncbi:MAG: SurA N-terminal domain-containing protein [Candidatus Alcyoniella australis]|nr:SurA N-terminal domain-containing protein [Candidatus Alcyoniella australis]
MSVLRRKKNHPILIALLGAVALSFVIFFGTGISGGGSGGSGSGKVSSNSVASVNGIQISIDQYRNEMRQMRDQVDQQLEQLRLYIQDEDVLEQQREQLLEAAKRQALERLVTTTLIQSYAQKHELLGSDAEVRAAITSIPYFQSGGRFDPQSYRAWLQAKRMSAESFEDNYRAYSAFSRLHAVIAGSAYVSDSEVRDEYLRRNERLRVEYISLDTTKLAQDAQVSDEEARSYYEAHPEQFIWPERREADFLTFEAFSYKDQVEVLDQEVEEYYNANLVTMFTDPEKVRASHVLVQVPQQSSDEVRQAALEKAELVLKRAQAADADFAELARKYSDDPGTRENGGDLGLVGRGQFVPQFEDAAFSVEPGELVGPVQTPFGYHVIRVTQKVPERIVPLEEAQIEIRFSLIQQRANELAQQRAQELSTQIAPGDSLREFARVHDLSVRSTGQFAATDPIPEVQQSQTITPQLFELAVDEISAPLSGGNVHYLFQLTRTHEARTKEFSECRNQAKTLALEDKRRNAATEMARGLLDQLKDGRELGLLAREQGLEIGDSGWITRGSRSIPGLGVAGELISGAFELNAENPLPDEPVEVGQRVAIYRLIEREEFDQAQFATQATPIHEQLLDQKRNVLLNAWQDYLRGSAEVFYDLEKL